MINWQDYEGRQALHCAVTDSTDAVVAAIIKYSSILTKKKNDCVSSRSPSCMLNALDNRLRSALHWAALVGRPSLVQMLLDRGAKALKRYFVPMLTFCKADLLDETGASPVHLGILSGSPDTVGVFVAAGSSTD